MASTHHSYDFCDSTTFDGKLVIFDFASSTPWIGKSPFRRTVFEGLGVRARGVDKDVLGAQKTAST